jgi:hypothetical protein
LSEEGHYLSRSIVLFVLLLPIVAAAAPVPPPTEQEQIAKLWGKIHAPSDKYEFKLNGKALTIRTAGEPAQEAGVDNSATIPYISRTATGDFEATVKLTAAATPDPKTRYQHGMPESRAGIQVIGRDKHARIELYQYFVVDKGVPRESPNQVVWYNVGSAKGGRGRHIEHAKPPTPLFLRITRQTKTLTLSHSFDGKEWGVSQVPAEFQPFELPDEVTLSIYLAHSTHQVMDAVFTDFTIEKPK